MSNGKWKKSGLKGVVSEKKNVTIFGTNFSEADKKNFSSIKKECKFYWRCSWTRRIFWYHSHVCATCQKTVSAFTKSRFWGLNHPRWGEAVLRFERKRAWVMPQLVSRCVIFFKALAQISWVHHLRRHLISVYTFFLDLIVTALDTDSALTSDLTLDLTLALFRFFSPQLWVGAKNLSRM